MFYALFLVLTLITLPCKADSVPSIGVIQVIEHPALDNTRKGILDELIAQGFSCPEKLRWSWESAQGNPALATQIAQKFISHTVIVAIGTTPAQAALAVAKDKIVNIVFSSVTDPVGARLVADRSTPGKQITGVSNFVDVEQQFALFKKILPHLKRLGIIYNPGEANSVALLKVMEAIARKMRITLVKACASRTSEVFSAAQGLADKVDALFINNDNTGLAAFDAIVKVGKAKKKPVLSSDTDMISKGALAVLGPNQYEIGRQTGRMIVRILRGEPPATLSIEYPQKVELHLNLKAAADIGLTIPQEIQKKASFVFREKK